MFNAIVFSWFLAFGWAPGYDSCVPTGYDVFNAQNQAIVSEAGFDLKIDRFTAFVNVNADYVYNNENDQYDFPLLTGGLVGAKVDLFKGVSINATQEIKQVMCSNADDVSKGTVNGRTKVFIKIEGTVR